MARTIFIVDDNPDDIEITRVVLTDLGRKEELKSARSGEAALELLRSNEIFPSLILLDLKTPGMSGIDTLRQIRADARLKDIPVIIATSSTFRLDEEAAYEAGADAFLYKSLDMDDFGRDLSSLLLRLLKF